ncbi:hypothetical protein [Blastococcus sp. CT_GayMR16]|uniref:hypothetical protein n=1 Tax=Blastococcus sp. CT_GayMR16 TaxID=2559607 RepID=UPI001074449E|nr:hypothetical protein [Blastococcus sp. CT_GayMR16]TFV90370.1 hypothetical protein E4P38_02715 [Blastococcus sp. CT_GayMR16]
MLTIVTFTIGAWVLVGAVVDVAQADEGQPVVTASCGVPVTVAPPGELGSGPPASVGPPQCDVPPTDGPPALPLPTTPATLPEPPVPAPVDVPVEVPPVVPEQVPAPEPAPHPGPAVTTTAAEPPSPAAEAAEQETADPAGPEKVDAAEDVAATIVAVEPGPGTTTASAEVPILVEVVCDVPEICGFGTAEPAFTGPQLSASADGRPFAVVEATSADGGTTIAPAGRTTTSPWSPLRPLAPLDLPLPQPSAPACPSAAAAAGASTSGNGHETHADSSYAVLDTRFAAMLTDGAVRSSSGFAGAIVGGADDPGVRPG